MFRFNQVDLSAGGRMITMKGIVILEANTNFVSWIAFIQCIRFFRAVLWMVEWEMPHRETLPDTPKMFDRITHL